MVPLIEARIGEELSLLGRIALLRQAAHLHREAADIHRQRALQLIDAIRTLTVKADAEMNAALRGLPEASTADAEQTSS